MIDLDFLSNDYQDNRPVAQKVAESIAIDILTGTLRPGQRISERVLCDKYALSRTPIREILNQLSSTGLVTLIPNRGAFVTGITERDIDDYFGLETLKLIVRQPLELTGTTEKFDIVCRVNGGGVTGQAGAIRHGLSRALLQYDESLRATLKKAGFLTRDPRMKERKKYGLKGARRAPQFSKR